MSPKVPGIAPVAAALTPFCTIGAAVLRKSTTGAEFTAACSSSPPNEPASMVPRFSGVAWLVMVFSTVLVNGVSETVPMPGIGTCCGVALSAGEVGMAGIRLVSRPEGEGELLGVGNVLVDLAHKVLLPGMAYGREATGVEVVARLKRRSEEHTSEL